MSSIRKNNARSRQNGLLVERLESRNLLAGITFEAGVVNIEGSANSDGALVSMSTPQQVSVELFGFDQMTIDAASVSRIVFHGHEGNDWFKNETSIPTEAFGNAGNDFLAGGLVADTLSGGNGNDQLFGNSGDDLLYGHQGLDHVFGDAGDDWIWTGSDDDFADGGAGRDQLFGGLGRDHLRGGSSDDHVAGEDHGDYLFGDDGNDSILGAADDDFINAGSGNDDVRGGSGNDAILGDAGMDHLVGDDGDDWMSGGSESDTLIGSAGNDQILGGAHNDEIRGGFGDDFLVGDDGDDLIGGDDGDDSIFGGTGNDDLFGDDGHDRINGQDGDDNIFGNAGHDFLNGNKGDDSVNGNAGSDFLRGHSGSDSLDGGSDDDDLAGGGGTDNLKGGLGNDDFINSSSDSVDSDASDFSADGDFEIRGEVSNLNTTARTFDLLGLTVSYASARLEGSFQNGSLVKAEGNFTSGVLTAYEVEIDNQLHQDNFEARGVIANLNPQTSTFEIYGIVVNYANAEVNTTLENGAAVFVEGNLNNGTVAAREIYPGNGQIGDNQIDRNFELRGQVTNLDMVAQTFDILGVTVDFSNAFLQNQFSDGSFIKVDGDLDSNTLIAREIELEIDDDRDENVEAVGVISNLNETAMTFDVLGVTVDYSNANVEDSLSDGMTVEVEGWFQSFTIDAERVRAD